MADTTTGGRSEAVKAVVGEFADDDSKVNTGDLKSEIAKNEKLDRETTDALIDAEDQEVLAKRTLNIGKTEAILAPQAAVTQYLPDDGGYNPEKRWFAGPSDTKVPSAVGKNQPMGQVRAGVVGPGWDESHLTAAGRKATKAGELDVPPAP